MLLFSMFFLSLFVRHGKAANVNVDSTGGAERGCCLISGLLSANVSEKCPAT